MIERHSFETTPPFNEPNEDTVLVKYVDVTKFLSILKEKSLFFCRTDKFEDKFEGTFPAITHSRYVEWRKSTNKYPRYNPNLTEEDINAEATDYLERLSKFRTLNCVNCWNKFEKESYALWKIYANLNQGIMLKTTYSNLINAFSSTNEKIYCSSVNYIDHSKDEINYGNTMSPFIHKHYTYSYEEEIRLIHEVSNKNLVHNWEDEKYETGLMIPLDIFNAFDEIVISPFAQNWFKELIEDVAKQYGLKCPVVDSVTRPPS